MSLRDDLIEQITEALCAKAKVHTMPETEQEWIRTVIRGQAETSISGFQAWLASDELIDSLHVELTAHGLDNDQALGAIYRVLSMIDKEAGG